MQQHYRTVHLAFNLPNFLLNRSSTSFLSFVILKFQSSFPENQKQVSEYHPPLNTEVHLNIFQHKNMKTNTTITAD